MYFPKLQHYRSLTTKLLSDISRTLVVWVLPLFRDSVGVFFKTSRLGKRSVKLSLSFSLNWDFIWLKKKRFSANSKPTELSNCWLNWKLLYSLRENKNIALMCYFWWVTCKCIYIYIYICVCVCVCVYEYVLVCVCVCVWSEF